LELLPEPLSELLPEPLSEELPESSELEAWVPPELSDWRALTMPTARPVPVIPRTTVAIAAAADLRSQRVRSE
jgi:hypothetical protein